MLYSFFMKKELMSAVFMVFLTATFFFNGVDVVVYGSMLVYEISINMIRVSTLNFSSNFKAFFSPVGMGDAFNSSNVTHFTWPSSTSIRSWSSCWYWSHSIWYTFLMCENKWTTFPKSCLVGWSSSSWYFVLKNCVDLFNLSLYSVSNEPSSRLGNSQRPASRPVSGRLDIRYSGSLSLEAILSTIVTAHSAFQQHENVEFSSSWVSFTFVSRWFFIHF